MWAQLSKREEKKSLCPYLEQHSSGNKRTRFWSFLTLHIEQLCSYHFHKLVFWRLGVGAYSEDSLMKEHLSPSVAFPVFHACHCQFPGFQGISWNSSGLPLPARALEETKIHHDAEDQTAPSLASRVLQVPVGSYTQWKPRTVC